MLLFPPNPNIGDTLVGPSGQMWVWDGVKWSNVISSDLPLVRDAPLNGITYSRKNGAWVTGVTNGSNAAPGEVGEYVAMYFATTSIAASNYSNVGNMQLSAGDWDVTGNVVWPGASPSTNTQVFVSLDATIPSPTWTNQRFMEMGRITIGVGAGITGGFWTPAVRINLSATAPVYLWTYSSAAGTGTGYLRARRMR